MKGFAPTLPRPIVVKAMVMHAGNGRGRQVAAAVRDSRHAHIGPDARAAVFAFSQASPHSLPDTEASHTSLRHSLQLPPSPARISTLTRPNPSAQQWQAPLHLPPSPTLTIPNTTAAQVQVPLQRLQSLKPNTGPEAESSQPALLSPEASSIVSGSVPVAETASLLPPRSHRPSQSPVAGPPRAGTGLCLSSRPLSAVPSPSSCRGRPGPGSGVAAGRSRGGDGSSSPVRGSGSPTPPGEPWRSPGNGSVVFLGKSSIPRSPKHNAGGAHSLIRLDWICRGGYIQLLRA
jgi:hypothetical protein